MLNDKEFSVLELLKTFCGREYKLFSLSVLCEGLQPISFSLEEMESVLKTLDEKGYVEIKYFKGEEVLIKPLPLGYSVIKHEQKPQILQSPPQKPLTKKDKLTVFFICFLGSLIGSFAVFVLGMLLC